MRHRRVSVLVVGLILASAGCGDDEDGSSAVTTTTNAETVIAEGEEWIAFQGTPQGISLIRPDGTGSHVILGPPGDQNHPDWSPDGSQIAYVQYDGSSSAAMITDLEGGNPRPVVESIPAELEGLSGRTQRGHGMARRSP